jgi:DNA end-binding protein Ku
MAASWKGFISFGLVSIPVSITPAARTERISFNQLHSVCHTRLKQPLYCPQCERFVERNEIEKGYEFEKDQYLLFTKEELEEIEPDSARVMDILEFVKLDEIDPLYYDASYYVAPEEAGVHAYHLLLNAMRKSGYAAIAKMTMYGREYIVIIRARDGGLALHTMFYANEVREAKDMKSDKSEAKPAEETLALQLIKNLAGPFKPEQYEDTYQAELQKLIEAKSHGKSISAPTRRAAPQTIDLLAALKKSVERPSAKEQKQKSLMTVVPKPGEARKKRRAG